MAAERGMSAARLALLWIKDQPGVTAPIIGPRTMQQLEDFLPVLDMTLADADRPLFDALVHPGNAVADFHNSNDWMKARIVDPPETVGMKQFAGALLAAATSPRSRAGRRLQKAEGSQLVAVMRRNGALAQDYARRHGVPRWYDDAQQLIDDPEVDAVYIATPPHMHKAYTLAVARAGKPVYVEKPMALNAAECQEMIDACRSAGVPLFVAYYRRALPRFVKVKELVDSGAIGELRFVQITSHPTAPKPFAADELPWRVQPGNCRRRPVCRPGQPYPGFSGLCSRTDHQGAWFCPQPGRRLPG